MNISNIIILLACIAFAAMVFMPFSNNSNAYQKIQNTTMDLKVEQVNLTTNAPLIGTVSFPNVFGLFKGIVDTMISQVGAIGDTFSSLADLPFLVKILLIGILTISLIYAVIGFWKGTNPS